MAPHALDNLSAEETNAASDLTLGRHSEAVSSFREIFLEEPLK